MDQKVEVSLHPFPLRLAILVKQYRQVALMATLFSFVLSLTLCCRSETVDQKVEVSLHQFPFHHIGIVVHNDARHDTQQHSLCPHAATPSLQIIHVMRDKDTFFKNRFGTMSSQERGRAALDTKMKKLFPALSW